MGSGSAESIVGPVEIPLLDLDRPHVVDRRAQVFVFDVVFDRLLERQGCIRQILQGQQSHRLVIVALRVFYLGTQRAVEVSQGFFVVLLLQQDMASFEQSRPGGRL